MKAIIASMILALASTSVWSQAGGLTNANVKQQTSITDPAEAVRQTENGWLAFSIPALDGTQSPCCWKGNWADWRTGQGEQGCKLNGRQQSFGTHSDSPVTENLIVMAEIQRGKLSHLRAVGEQCPVDGDGENVLWIGDVDSTAGLNWLESMAVSSNGESIRHSALFAMALHRSEEVAQRLYKMARGPETGDPQETVFWLGEARGEAGLDSLERLLEELPQGDTRRQINFALAQNGSSAAFELLTRISRSDADPEQRSTALFWLAEAFPEQAGDILLKALADEQNQEVKEQAVFAVSQLPHEMSSPMLLDIARDSQQSDEVRKQALFWLANSDDERAVAALTELLTR
jgi:hypothetical protein